MKKRFDDMEKVTILFSVILLLFFLISSLLGIFMENEIIKTIASTLAELLIPLLLFNLLYEYLTRKYTANETSKMLTSTIVGNKEMIEAFDVDVRKNFIRVTLDSILTEKKADLTYQLIEGYLNKNNNIRSQFSYDITYRQLTDELKTLYSEKDYHQLTEYLKCTKTYRTDTLTDKIKIIFSRNQDDLGDAFKDDFVIFRELMHVNDVDFEQMVINIEQDKDRLFMLELWVQGRRLVCQTASIINKGKKSVGIEFEYETPKILLEHKGPEVDIEYKVIFKLLQLKKVNKFLVILSEPTLSPSIRFSYIKEEMKNIDVIPFFDQEFDANAVIQSRETALDFIKVDFDGWIMPTSGAVFTWDKD